MTGNGYIQELARQQARKILSESATFFSLPKAEQMSVYADTVRAVSDALSKQPRLSGAMAEPKKAGDLIDDKRHANKRIDQAGELAGEFIENVDFPKFVRDLLKGVFDANLEVTLKQMDKYVEMLKAATASISKFVNAIDDTAAFGYLAENNGDEFGIDFDDSRRDDNGQPTMRLTDPDGNAVDLGDNQVKAKIMDAKLAMAKEQRALLRETLLMGVNRLVVEKGIVKASVLFDIKASERIEKADKAAIKKQKSNSSSISASGGLIGSIFGGPSGGHTRSERETQISVSSAKSVASTDLAAKITGSVEINFKSDYFKLDNFAEMYAGLREQPAPTAAPAVPRPAMPAPAPAPMPAAAVPK